MKLITTFESIFNFPLIGFVIKNTRPHYSDFVLNTVEFVCSKAFILCYNFTFRELTKLMQKAAILTLCID